MTRYFYDTEFLDNGKTITPISIGIVADDGREYCATFGDFMMDDEVLMEVRRHGWLMANVVPHLPQAAREFVMGRQGPPAPGHHEIKPKWLIAHEVAEFITVGGGNREDNELWAYYAAYDHVLLAQLWGPMMMLPAVVPMYSHDLRQELARAARAGIEVFHPHNPAQHSALSDARVNQQLFNALREALRGVVIDGPGEEQRGVTVPRRWLQALYERAEGEGDSADYLNADELPQLRQLLPD